MPNEKQIERELQVVNAIRSGSEDGQYELVRIYKQRIFSLIYSIIPNVQDAEELTQDTFIKALEHIRSFNPERSTLSAWLYKIACNSAISFARKRRPPVVLMDDVDLSSLVVNDSDIDEELATVEEGRLSRMKELIQDLTAREKAMLNVYYLEDRTLAEAARILGRTPEALSRDIYDIRKKLYLRLSKN